MAERLTEAQRDKRDEVQCPQCKGTGLIYRWTQDGYVVSRAEGLLEALKIVQAKQADIDRRMDRRLYPAAVALNAVAKTLEAAIAKLTDDVTEEEARAALPFGFERAEQLLEPICACGHVISRCSGSRRGCRKREVSRG